MPTCKNCGKPTDIGHVYCSDCLNNWLIMKEIIQTHLVSKYGEATREIMPIMTNDFKTLNNLWKRDRVHFEREVSKW